jgi:hypothetical protein
MLAGAEGGRRVDPDRDRPRRHAAPKGPADPQCRETALIFGQPIAVQQLFLAGIDERASGRSGGNGNPRHDGWGQHRRIRPSAHAPLLGRHLEGRDGLRQFVEEASTAAAAWGPRPQA